MGQNEEIMEFGVDFIQDALKEFGEVQEKIGEIRMLVKGKPNDVDPMYLLRAHNDSSMEVRLGLAERMLEGKTFSLVHGDETIVECKLPKGGSILDTIGTDNLWAVDIITAFSNSMLLKKFTPRLHG